MSTSKKSSCYTCKQPYSTKRYITFAIITVLALIIPFIRINGNHFFLLSFDKKMLNLFFTSFTTQEFWLMPFILIALFLFIFFLTTLAGRVWCGWTCPQTILRFFYRDVIQTKLLKIYPSIANKQKKIKGKRAKRALAIFIWLILSVLIASNFLWYFIPPEDFFVYIKNPADHPIVIGIILGVALFIFVDIAFLQERFCVYICPYARVQSVMFDNDTIQVIYNENRGGKLYDHGVKIAKKPQGKDDLCIGCEACVHICPTHIDIRKGMQLECINCLECADACSKVMARFDTTSLIEWTSKNAVDNNTKVKIFRFRTVAYLVVLSVVLIALSFMASTKTNMLLNINRDSQLYSIHLKKGKPLIQNNYVFMIENTSQKSHKYYFKIDNKDIKIVRPTKPVKISAGAKKRIIVTLEADKKLGDNSKKDLILPINVHAFAIKDKENIFIDKDSNFVYPKEELIIKKKKGK